MQVPSYLPLPYVVRDDSYDVRTRVYGTRGVGACSHVVALRRLDRRTLKVLKH